MSIFEDIQAWFVAHPRVTEALRDAGVAVAPVIISEVGASLSEALQAHADELHLSAAVLTVAVLAITTITRRYGVGSVVAEADESDPSAPDEVEPEAKEA